MTFSLDRSIELLERTPNVFKIMLLGLSADWTATNEGGDTWSPYDVLGHLIHGERTDWIPRAEVILAENADKTFTPFDRFAQFEESMGKSLAQLLDEFAAVRSQNLDRLRAFNLTDQDLDKKGVHPALGEVTLSQLLATWVVHDLNHIAQISRVMAYQYKNEVGPWIEYLRILNS
ncbi:hypothetical protein BN8_05038 [Fibrisoma limi BUZ 3]|uniref:DinB-like domain-containing protein n=1 Tax=Fibrisoma limi BUZ 3 TaxID=1185876 RepID=I2GPC5_9BACT|nr:DinB family protein [Fibrisoma limi]CCH55753.1 hypothetical protein BN8_05038 [Fibrisoma limi BUZ 3]